MITRRNLLQLAGLSGVGVAAPSLLTGCSGAGPDGAIPGIDLAASNVAFGKGDTALIPDAVKGLSAMGGQLLGELEGAPGNLAISPFSIAVALAMTVNGARGQTRRQMLDVLGAGQVNDLNDGLAALIRHLDGLAGEMKDSSGKKVSVALDTANTLFGQRDIHWEAAFLDALKRSYDAGMRMVDYQSETEVARRLINDWVSSQTHTRIPELIPDGVLDALTRLVLVNALYFKAPWLQQFDDISTRSGAFHLADGATKTVDLMWSLMKGVRYSETDLWQTVRLPYVGDELAMTVVLPRPGMFDRVWQTVTSGRTDRVLATQRAANVDLTLPKWTFRSQAPLNDPLKALGMSLAFDSSRADFTGMTTEADLYISAVLHETWLAVDENGTEAAAATAVVVSDTAAVLGVEMKVDRPFLFAIHDTKYLTPLFIGRVMDPTKG